MADATVSPVADTGQAVAYADQLHVGETVIVTLFGAPPEEDSPSTPDHEVAIKEDGTISLPLIGDVQAAGKTPGIRRSPPGVQSAPIGASPWSGPGVRCGVPLQ